MPKMHVLWNSFKKTFLKRSETISRILHFPKQNAVHTSKFEIFTIGLYYTMQVSIEKIRVKFVEVCFKIQFLNRLSLRK